MKIKTDASLVGSNYSGDSYSFPPSRETAKMFTLDKDSVGEAPDYPWPDPYELREVRDEILRKFNYIVDVFLVTPVSMAVRPRRSNLNTAIVTWHENAKRYEILSLRIWRNRRLRSSIVSRDDEFRVVAVKDAKRTASFVAGLAPYSDKEVSEYVVDSLAPNVMQIIGQDDEAFAEAFKQFRWKLDREDAAKDILLMLDAIKQNNPIHLKEDSELLTLYTQFDTNRKAIEEKKAHAGKLAPMFMLRSSVNKTIILATRCNGSEIFAKSYDSFDGLPREVQRAVMTLEVKEKNHMGLAEGVGIIPNDWAWLGGECCGFVIQEEIQEKFVEEVMSI